MRYRLMALTTAAVLLGAVAATVIAEDRTIDGSFNNKLFPAAGAAGLPMIRFGYETDFPGDGTGSTIIEPPYRANPRVISNTIFSQTTSIPNSRRLSDMTWLWGQFMDHDMDLSTTDPAAGTANIPCPPGDILGPLIPFTRSKYTLAPSGDIMRREVFNEASSYIDGSVVYGSDPVRAAALRTNGGAGARLLTGQANLLPFNTMGLANDNPRRQPEADLFVAGDIRSNENVLLSSMHTIFMREHNRLVGIIEWQQPNLSAEQTYQLARKIVGAELQITTYKEFLPALLGAYAPKAEDYVYDPTGPAAITNAFAHATYRFGHSMLSQELALVSGAGTAGSISLAEAFANPYYLVDEPGRVDQLLAGAAAQRAQEVDAKVVDAVRNALFGQPGFGGTDLASLNIQRGRDHGLPDYNTLRDVFKNAKIGDTQVGAADSFQLGRVSSFSQITSDPILAQILEDLYGSVDNIDPWVGALAEDLLPGAAVGPFVMAVVGNQFTRLRDHDRLFYLSEDLGLYSIDCAGKFILDPAIAAIIDLDNLTLANVIEANTSITGLQDNVFFASSEPVPEPVTCSLLAIGAILLATRRIRRRTTEAQRTQRRE